MSEKSERKRLELEKIEGEPVAERLGDALEGRSSDDAAWNEQYATPTKKPKPASKQYPEPKTR